MKQFLKRYRLAWWIADTWWLSRFRLRRWWQRIASIVGATGYRNQYRRQYEEICASRIRNAKGVFVYAGNLDWYTSLVQRPQHLAKAMRDRGYVVFYLQIERTKGFQEVDRNIFVCSEDWALCGWLPAVSDAIVSVYSTRTQPPRHVLNAIARRNCFLYEYIDAVDEKISGLMTFSLQNLYDYFIRNKKETLFLASAQLLRNDLVDDGVAEDRILLSPNAVDAEHFCGANCEMQSTPNRIRGIIQLGRPVVGYFGAVAPWLDYKLIDEILQRCSDMEFLFVGPDYRDGSRDLPGRANCHWIGPVEYAELPQYAKHFDVAIIPFAEGEIARTTSPLKLFEYFALQKPVIVTTGMDECVAYPEVLHGDTAPEFARMIRKGYTFATNHEYTSRLRELAEQNSWKQRARDLDRFIQKHWETMREEKSL